MLDNDSNVVLDSGASINATTVWYLGKSYAHVLAGPDMDIHANRIVCDDENEMESYYLRKIE